MATHQDQESLLADLSKMGSYGRAEGESKDSFACTFYPVTEHVRAFDPDVVLVVGPRGAGKSELFRAVIELGLLPEIARHTPGLRLPPTAPKRTKWLAGYPIAAGFPDALGISRFVKSQDDAPDALLELWFAYLVRVLHSELDEQGKKELAELMKRQGGEALSIHQEFRTAGESSLLALDRLDARLEKEDRRVFIAYDELDTLGGANWEVMNQAVHGLVSFWANYTRRWRRIRAKIFLRTDLYQRVGAAGGAELAKLAANRAELTWSDRNLYAMLVKRLGNTSDDLLTYCRRKVDFLKDPSLGYIPEIERPQDARPLVEQLIGPYMGSNLKKGVTYRWLLEHIRDGRGHALPRPLVRLIELSAGIQLNSSGYPRWPRLLEPPALRRALDKVSEEHVRQSLSEWPWLEGLATRLKGEQVPWEGRQIERLLDKSWEHPWAKKENVLPPASSAREFIDYLVEVGIFRSRTDGRIDVPDLFLAGLGLKRKGGVRQA